MDFCFTPEQLALQDMAQTFAAKELRPRAAQIDTQSLYDPTLLHLLGSLGFLSLNIPIAYGGAGISDLLSQALVIRELAKECASTAEIVAINAMVNDVLTAFGTQQQQEKYLSATADGALGAFAMTEPNAGSDAASIRTSATFNGAGYELNGEKCFISNIGTQVGHHAIVFAVTDPQKGKAGISAFIVEHGTPGFCIGSPENKMGIRAAIVSGVAFNHCQIPTENRIGNEGDGYAIAMYALERGRISMAAQAVGISEAAIAKSAAYLSVRQQFGAALERQQGLQWYLAEMATRTEAALALIYRACDAAERDLPLLKYSSMCKYFAAETAVYVTNKALQLHGGYGYMKDYPIERLYRDARITPIYEGTSEIQKNLIAREIIRDLQKECRP